MNVDLSGLEPDLAYLTVAFTPDNRWKASLGARGADARFTAVIAPTVEDAVRLAVEGFRAKCAPAGSVFE